jgi:trimethylamine:corrinoid methyltransferase-like protein
MGILLGALSGANLFAVGMLNFETALTMENMVIANEIAGNAYRLLGGVDTSDEHFATDIWEEVGHRQDFLGTMHTISHFEKEQFSVSALTDRDSETEWERKGSKDTAARAHDMVKEILSADIPKIVDPKVEQEIDAIVIEYAKTLGIGRNQMPQEFFAD